MTQLRFAVVWACVLAAAGMACRLGFNPMDEPANGDAGAPGSDAIVATGDGSVADASGPPGCWTWVPAHFDPCDLEDTTLELVLDAPYYEYDTDTGELFDDLGDPVEHQSQVMMPMGYQVISVERFELLPGVTLRAFGNRPLVIAAAEEIIVDGLIDVGSYENDDAGAGSEPPDCLNVEPDPGEPGFGGAGGGGGGGYRGAGGNGGDADNNEPPPSAGGAGGMSRGVPAQVSGGCSGADGGDGFSNAGRGGLGGGAVELVSDVGVYLDGRIHAGGGGGKGGPSGDNGGGGGGSGGYIGLDAPEVVLAGTAILAANGGAGGGGSSGTRGRDGQNGRLENSPAVGGAGGGGIASPGGDGSAGGQLDGDSQDSFPAAAGGGGGGGAGYILVFTDRLQDDGAMVSPRHIEP